MFDIINIACDKLQPHYTKLSERASKLCKRTAWLYHRLFHLALCTVKIYLRKQCARAAAQFSFYVIFTLFPLLICINWFVGVLHTNYDSLIIILEKLLPASAMNIIIGYLDYLSAHQSNTMLYAGLFMMITPASGALRSLQQILCDIENRGRRRTIWDFWLSFPFAIVFLLTIYICVALLFSGGQLLRFLINEFELNDSVQYWNWLRFFLLFAVSSMLLYLLYRFLPFSVRSPRTVLEKRRVYPGVIFSAFTLVVVSIIFSAFISYSSRYSLVYGSLASIIIFMLWLYVCSNIIIIGGIINRLTNQFRRHLRLSDTNDNRSVSSLQK